MAPTHGCAAVAPVVADAVALVVVAGADPVGAAVEETGTGLGGGPSPDELAEHAASESASDRAQHRADGLAHTSYDAHPS